MNKVVDIEKEIETLIEKYEIKANVLLKDRLAGIIRKIMADIVKKYGSRVVIRGIKLSPDNCYPLLSLIEEQAEIIGVMDQKPFADKINISEHRSIPFIDKEQIESLDYDCYIINALYSGKNIYYEVRDKLEKQGIGVIDLYKTIRVQYSFCPSRLYEEYDLEKDQSYNCLQDCVLKFRIKKNSENLKELLGSCLAIKDFVAFFRYAEEGKDIIKKEETLQNLVNDIQLFLDKIQDNINRRTEDKFRRKDIVLHWVDQVSYDELSYMPRMSERLKGGLFFKQAYTVTPYTQPTARMIFWKEFRGIKDLQLSGRYENKDLKESSLYRNIEKKGYEFEAFGYVKKILDKTWDNAEECEFSIAASVHYWNMLRKLLLSERPVFYMVHILNETHEPYISPEADRLNQSYEFQASYKFSLDKIKLSTAYADEVIDFYSNLLGNDIMGIYMSDHGKWEDIDRRRYKDEVMHTILGITNAGIVGEVERLFSYENFDELVLWLLKMASPEEMFFCDIPIYSPGFRAAIKERIGCETDICNGYQGIKTFDDKYIQLDTGEEYYFLRQDKEQINRMEDYAFKERIDILKRRYIQLKNNITFTEE